MVFSNKSTAIEIHICLGFFQSYSTGTVQTFNSCASRPDVCQCLVVQTPMDKQYIDIKPTFSCEVNHASMSRKLGCNRACGSVLWPDCPGI